MAGESEENDRLCFTSEKFDSSYALKSNVTIPVSENAKVFNNLDKYVEGLFQSASFRSLKWMPSVILDDAKCKVFKSQPKKCPDQQRITNLSTKTKVEGKEHKRSEKGKNDGVLRSSDSAPVAVGLYKQHADESNISKNALKMELQVKSKGLSQDAVGHKEIQAVTRSDRLQSLMNSDVAVKDKTGRQTRFRPNVLERMEGFKEGPLSVLYNCMNKGVKLKVWTRRHTGFRGVCIGYLIAFDKHMNLAMIDVDEVYTIEAKSLSIEEQMQMQKQKKANKRNRNRLNRIKRAMEQMTENNVDGFNDIHQVEKSCVIPSEDPTAYHFQDSTTHSFQSSKNKASLKKRSDPTSFETFKIEPREMRNADVLMHEADLSMASDKREVNTKVIIETAGIPEKWETNVTFIPSADLQSEIEPCPAMETDDSHQKTAILQGTSDGDLMSTSTKNMNMNIEYFSHTKSSHCDDAGVGFMEGSKCNEDIEDKEEDRGPLNENQVGPKSFQWAEDAKKDFRVEIGANEQERQPNDCVEARSNSGIHTRESQCDYMFCFPKKFAREKPEFYFEPSIQCSLIERRVAYNCNFAIFGRFCGNQCDEKPEALLKRSELQKEISHVVLKKGNKEKAAFHLPLFTEKESKIQLDKRTELCGPTPISSESAAKEKIPKECVDDPSNLQPYVLMKLETDDPKKDARLRAFEMLEVLPSDRCSKDPRLRKASIERENRGFQVIKSSNQEITSSGYRNQDSLEIFGHQIVEGSKDGHLPPEGVFADTNSMDTDKQSECFEENRVNEKDRPFLHTAVNRRVSSDSEIDDVPRKESDGWGLRMLANILESMSDSKNLVPTSSSEDVEMKQCTVTLEDADNNICNNVGTLQNSISEMRKQKDFLAEKEGGKPLGREVTELAKKKDGLSDLKKVSTTEQNRNKQDKAQVVSSSRKDGKSTELQRKAQNSKKLHRSREANTSCSVKEGITSNNLSHSSAYVLKRRHVNQLFIRGDNVALVACESQL